MVAIISRAKNAFLDLFVTELEGSIGLAGASVVLIDVIPTENGGVEVDTKAWYPSAIAQAADLPPALLATALLDTPAALFSAAVTAQYGNPDPVKGLTIDAPAPPPAPPSPPPSPPPPPYDKYGRPPEPTGAIYNPNEKDTEPPVITLLGDARLEVAQLSLYEDPGAAHLMRFRQELVAVARAESSAIPLHAGAMCLFPGWDLSRLL